MNVNDDVLGWRLKRGKKSSRSSIEDVVGGEISHNNVGAGGLFSSFLGGGVKECVLCCKMECQLFL